MMNADRGDNPKLTLLPFLISALCRTLPDYPQMNLSLSRDHRVVDGWDAANFMQALKALIENPLKLLSMC